MKKLLLAAVVLTLLVGGAWAQEFTSTTVPDDARVVITVKMTGLQFTVNKEDATDGSGADSGQVPTIVLQLLIHGMLLGREDRRLTPLLINQLVSKCPATEFMR